MITIQFTKNGQAGTRKVHTFALKSTLANYRAAGYEILSDGTAPAAPVEAPKVQLTGRVGKASTVHEMVEGGGTKCGTGYRRGRNLEFKITGETVDCTRCLGH